MDFIGGGGFSENLILRETNQSKDFVNLTCPFSCGQSLTCHLIDAKLGTETRSLSWSDTDICGSFNFMYWNRCPSGRFGLILSFKFY